MTQRRRPGPGQGSADDQAFEERLRVALAQEVRELQPGNRLDEIRLAVAQPPRRAGLARWVLPLSTAAAVAAIAVVAWLGLHPGTLAPVPVGTTTPSPTASASPAPTVPPATGSTEPTGGASTEPTGGASPSSDPQTAPAPVAVALPVFYLAPEPAAVQVGAGLVRQFVQVQMPPGADATSRVKAALITAVKLPTPNLNGFLQVWPAGETVGAVTVAQEHISVELSAPGRTGLPAAQQRLAVQQLVWTATAAAGQDVPVTISLVTGARIFETVPGGTFKRPAADQAFTELAPIWVDSPYVGQSFAAGASVVVKGQACTFEAAVAWELRQGNAVVRKGNTTASSGCPQQGSWSVDLGKLPPGAYEFRGMEVSAKDGSISARTGVLFTVGLVPTSPSS